MTIYGVGIDVVHVARISRLRRSSDRFSRHWFTAGEISECGAAAQPDFAYAERLAAKEAVWKALRLEGWPGSVPWRLIGTVREGTHARVRLAGEVAEHVHAAGIDTIMVDWLVADHVAVAVAIAESAPSQPGN